MPEDNEIKPPNPFFDEPLKPYRPEPEIKPADDLNSRWATFSGLIPGIVLIILSILFFLDNNLNILADWWQYFLVLLLVVFLIEYWVVYMGPAKGKNRLKMGIIGFLLIAVGILFLFILNKWLPLVLLLAGIILIAWFIFQKRNRKTKTEKTAIENNPSPQ
jgi:chromate transport protein ChrA